MSPTAVPTGGPYVKHHCKNFMTDDCPNWVYIANTACIDCVAAGRDQEDTQQSYKHSSAGAVEHVDDNEGKE